MVFLKARQKSLTFLGFSITKLIMQLSLNIYFIVFLGMKVEGVIYSALITGTVMSLILSSYTFSITGFRFSLSKARELFRFSVPLIGAAILSFYFTFGDRYFLQLFIDNEAVGIYSLAYRFGFLLPFLVVGPFSSIWNSEMYHVADSENGTETFKKVFLVLSTAMFFFAVSISVFIREILMIMSDPDFWPAARVVPLIMGAYLLQGWTWYGSLGILIKEKTIEKTYANIICVIVITPGYLFLIPLYGPMGAGLATFLAFAARCFYLNWRAKKLLDMQLPWTRMIPASALSMGAILITLVGPTSLLPALFFDIVVMLVFTILFFLLPILPKELKKALIGIILKPKNVISVFK
jgi:O-antigen/teichoic acid export membrane protein